MRAQIAEALKTAIRTQDKKRTSTLRLINAAIQDRDIANRGQGKDQVSDDEILQILTKMVKQREEIAIIRDFLPKQMAEDQVRSVCQQVIRDIGADGLRDMGKCMNALKEKYPGQMDFGKASGIVKTMLQ
jgi:uncharacterized protein YqeY